MNDPSREIASLAKEIERKCKFNWGEALNLAMWIYQREHPEFNDEVLA